LANLNAINENNEYNNNDLELNKEKLEIQIINNYLLKKNKKEKRKNISDDIQKY